MLKIGPCRASQKYMGSYLALKEFKVTKVQAEWGTDPRRVTPTPRPGAFPPPHFRHLSIVGRGIEKAGSCFQEDVLQP